MAQNHSPLSSWHRQQAAARRAVPLTPGLTARPQDSGGDHLSRPRPPGAHVYLAPSRRARQKVQIMDHHDFTIACDGHGDTECDGSA